MELLLRTNFDIPRPHTGAFDPLSYLSLSSGKERSDSISPESSEESECRDLKDQHPAISSDSAESLTPTAVLTLARRILDGNHAVPTRLKILLDRALDRLTGEERNIILGACSWNYEDYLRGYKLKNSDGSPLDRWNMCTKAQESMLLQQFLAFKETRSITQQLVLQDLADRSAAGSTFANAMASAEKSELAAKSEEDVVVSSSPKESLLKMVSSHKLYNRPCMSPPHNTHEEDRMRQENRSPPAYARSVSPIPSSVGNMHSKDSPLFPRRLSNGIPLPASSMGGMPPMLSHFPMFPFPGLPAVSLPQPSNPQHFVPTSSNSENDFNGALNLSRPDKSAHERSSPDVKDSPKRRLSIDAECKRAQLPDDLGIPYVSPSTGKKRTQCNVCMKTFCDKGALKIHFSAVHLREMHKCSVPGCNMMFSSRRSRNRHSANPNPKLHTPTVKRRISQTDGRTHPGPITPLMPKDSPAKATKENFGMPSGFPTQLPFPGLPGFNPFLPPDLKTLQADLQRISDLQKLYSNGGLAGSPGLDGSRSPQTSESIIDLESLRRMAGVASMASSEDGNRKRKSQNPTKRPHLDIEDVEQISTDSASDEGFPDPMMDDDDIDSISVDDDQS